MIPSPQKEDFGKGKQKAPLITFQHYLQNEELSRDQKS